MARFHALARLQVRMEARDLGFHFFEINRRMAGCTDEIVEKALTQAKAATGQEVPTVIQAVLSGATPVGADAVGEWGDGHILQAILDFFKSDLGQMIIKLLLSFLFAV